MHWFQFVLMISFQTLNAIWASKFISMSFLNSIIFFFFFCITLDVKFEKKFRCMKRHDEVFKKMFDRDESRISFEKKYLNEAIGE